MQQFNFFEAMYKSFYSKALYRDVAVNWGGYTILYLLTLLALSWIVGTWQIQSSLNLAFKKYSFEVFSQIPVVTIKDGKVSTPQPRPYAIYEPRSKDVAVMIDTTGKYRTLQDANASVLITETQVLYAGKKNEMRTYTIPSNYNRVITPVGIYSFISKFIGYLWIPIFLSCLFVSFVYRIIQVYLYGLIGKLFNYFYGGTDLTYIQMTQIAMIAVTPAIVLTTLNDWFNFHYPYQLLLYFILSLLYMFYGIVANGKRHH